MDACDLHGTKNLQRSRAKKRFKLKWNFCGNTKTDLLMNYYYFVALSGCSGIASLDDFWSLVSIVHHLEIDFYLSIPIEWSLFAN